MMQTKTTSSDKRQSPDYRAPLAGRKHHREQAWMVAQIICSQAYLPAHQTHDAGSEDLLSTPACLL